MRYTIIFSSFLIFTLLGCNKDKFDTVPFLEFTSVNTNQLRSGDLLKFTLSFTDKEGDISNKLHVIKSSPECPTGNYVADYAIPNFPAKMNQKGEITITFGYNVSGIPAIILDCKKDETATFRFVIEDRAGNISDTVSSPPITIFY
ncbi:MAG: hypothetical protein ABIN48_15030 [Ginsengibacter sp.]